MKKVQGKRRSLRIGDATTEIAIAKARSRFKGPFKQACSACGEYYWSNQKEEHLEKCNPSEIHLLTKKEPMSFVAAPQKLEASIKATTPKRAAHLRIQRPAGRVCPFCGKTKIGLEAHIREP